MKKIISFVLALLLASVLRAGHQKASDLVASLEDAVQTAARGDIHRAFLQLNTESRDPKPEEEPVIVRFQKEYAKVSGLGELDQVERMSLVYMGDSLFRLRMIEKRAKGVVLWTLIGYRYKGVWYCREFNFDGGGDMLLLMHQDLDPSDARIPPNEKGG